MRIGEFDALREEINQLNALATSTVHISLVSLLSIIGIFSQLESLSFMLFPLPFFMIIPSLFIVISRFQAVMRISGYITAFLEPYGLHYENRYRRYLAIAKPKGRIQFTYRGTIFWLYCGLGLLSVGLFISKGFTSWYLVLSYFAPLPFYFYAYRAIHQNWRYNYSECWEQVGKEEKEKTKAVRQQKIA